MGLVVHLNPFRETLGISWPTQFTDVETEGQSRETHGQAPVARSSDSPGACSFQSTFGQKQLYGAQPVEKLTEQDLGRTHMWPDVWNRPLSSQVCKPIRPSSSKEGAGTGQRSGSCSLEFWAQV